MSHTHTQAPQQKQVFRTKNGKEIVTPKGYASLQHYLDTCKLNLSICKKQPGKYSEQIAIYTSIINNIEA